MQSQSSIPNVRADLNSALPITSPNCSAISWGAILAGAAVAAALAFIFIILGIGLGFSTVSPWQNEGLSAQTLTISSIIWLTLTQIASCAMGGYIAGRLRVRWIAVHTDEVHFRDTAHGLLVWAVSCLVTVAFLASAISGIVGGVAKVGSSVASAAMHSATIASTMSNNNDTNNSNSSNLGYYINSLFRADTPVANDSSSANMEMEASKIFIHDLYEGALSTENKTYIAKLVAKKTNLNQVEAEKRVETIYAKADKAIKDAKEMTKQAADKARKGLAMASLWIFVALLCGAFSASLMATCGGRQRDNIKHIV